MAASAGSVDQNAASPESVTLSDGTPAQLVERDDGWTLEIDGVRQSHVGPPGAPPVLATVRWMLAALGSEPMACAHLGGGLLTLPRAITERNDGSQQIVVELEPALAELAQARFGLPEGITIQIGDGRAWLEAPTTSDLDAVVIDVFAGGRIPPAFTSKECFGRARDALSAGGMLILNSVAGPELLFTRRELAALRAEFEHVAMIVQGSALNGLRFGNAVLLASGAPLDVGGIRAALAGDSSRGALVTDVESIIDGAEPASDADELWSPVPDLPEFDDALRLIDTIRKMRASFTNDAPL